MFVPTTKLGPFASIPFSSHSIEKVAASDMSRIERFLGNDRLSVEIFYANLLAILIAILIVADINKALSLEKLFAAGLFQQHNIRNSNILRHCFAHIINGECGRGHGTQRFHFNARLSFALDRGPDVDAAIGHIQHGIYNDRRYWNVMTQRNNLGRSLGANDAGNLGNRHHVALFHAVLFDELGDLGPHVHRCRCDGQTFGDILVVNVDHARFTGFIDMRQFVIGWRSQQP